MYGLEKMPSPPTPLPEGEGSFGTGSEEFVSWHGVSPFVDAPGGPARVASKGSDPPVPFGGVGSVRQLDQDLIAPEREHDALAGAGQVHDHARLVPHPQFRLTRRGESGLPRSL